jgi:hypothetical protein
MSYNAKFKKIILIFTVIFLVAFLLNYFWESLHAVFLYSDHNFEAARYVMMLLYVSFIDVILIITAYILTALINHNIFWIEKIGKRNVIPFIILGLIFAFIIELISVYKLERWSYNEYMPLIFGIGLSPLIQLSLTGLVTVWISQTIIFKKIKK